MNIGFEILAASMVVCNVVQGWGPFKSSGYERSVVISSTDPFQGYVLWWLVKNYFIPGVDGGHFKVPGLDDVDTLTSTKETVEAKLTEFSTLIEGKRGSVPDLEGAFFQYIAVP